MGIVGWLIVMFIVFCLVAGVMQARQQNEKNAAEAEKYGVAAIEIARHGTFNTQLVCPHCQTKGKVMTKPITKKAGVSGAKATGALLTGGVSLLATGLSRKDALTEAHCSSCSSTWHY